MKLCPPLSFFPSSSSSSDRSSFDKGSRSEYHDQRKQLLSGTSPPPRYTLFESHLGGSPSAASALESITRGPDGRFVVQPYAAGASSQHIKRSFKRDFPQSPGRGSSRGGSIRDSPRPGLWDSDREEQGCSPLALAADASASVSPHFGKLAGSPGRVRTMARNFSRHGCFHSDDEQAGSEALLERASFYSDNSEKRVCESPRRYRSPGHPEDLLPSGLPSRRARYQPMEPDGQLSPDGTVLTHLEVSVNVSESERVGLDRRRRLAREREELERELEGYACGQRGIRDRAREERRAKSVSPLRSCYSPAAERQDDDDPVWKPLDASLRAPNRRPSSLAARRVSDYRRGCCFGTANTSSPLERAGTPFASHITWDISPVSSPSGHVPSALSLSEGNTPRARRPLSPPQDDSSSADADGSCSPVTALTLLSPTSHGPVTSDLSRGRSHWPQQSAETPVTGPSAADLRDTVAAESARKTSVSPVCSDSLQPVCESVRRIEGERERSTSPRPPSRPTSPAADETGADEERPDGRPRRTPSSYSTLPYEQRTGVRAGKASSPSVEEMTCASALLDQEREALRARSRKSERLALGLDSPSRVSPLTLLESVSMSDQSNLSRMCESTKARLGPPPPPAARTSSPVQTSAILEYLSLPGFIEMSVDEPLDVSAASADPEASSLLSGEPDVVPRNWETHAQDGAPQHNEPPTIPLGQSRELSDGGVQRPGGAEEEEVVVEEVRPDSAQPLLSVKSLGSPARNAQKMGSDLAHTLASAARSDLAHTLVSAARSVAVVASRSPERFERLPLQTSPEDETQR